MREETEFKPKPMVQIGDKPVLHHLMEIYSRFGFNEFIILAGYRADIIQDYFYNFRARTNAFSVKTKTGEFEVHGELEDWKVTVLNTGVESLTADRLLAAKPYLGAEPFMLTYGDGLANVDLNKLVELHRLDTSRSVMTITALESRFGQVDVDSSGTVTSFAEKPRGRDKVNIGFFLFTHEVFDYAIPGTMLEQSALKRLASDSKLQAHEHEGFWMPMDTFREYEKLNEIYRSGRAPWIEFPANSG
tara:strand:+ start:3155 stop:3892 length:738 start_codon:yes stop_codon:yes gene_type:complete